MEIATTVFIQLIYHSEMLQSSTAKSCQCREPCEGLLVTCPFTTGVSGHQVPLQFEQTNYCMFPASGFASHMGWTSKPKTMMFRKRLSLPCKRYRVLVSCDLHIPKTLKAPNAGKTFRLFSRSTQSNPKLNINSP